MNSILRRRSSIGFALAVVCAVLGAPPVRALDAANSQTDQPIEPTEPIELIELIEQASEWEVLETRPADGEQCLVCRQLIHEGDIVEVRYKGRTFHVAVKMLEEFKADPDRYFYAMQAHSGLFDEASMETPPMAKGWLSFGFYVLAGLFFGAICAYAALNRGLSAPTWFVAGLLVNVFALIALLFARRGLARIESAPPGLSKIPLTPSPVPCPDCGNTNHPLASACSACGRSLNPGDEPETARI